VTGGQPTLIRKIAADVKLCVAAGLLIAAFLCLIGILVFVFKGPQFFEDNQTSLTKVLFVYLAAGVLGGLIIGLSLRLTKWMLGAALIGFVTALIVWFLVGWSISPREPIQEILKSSAVLGAAFGLPVSIGLWYQVRRFRRTGRWS
jgi:hypothetical protein